MKVIWVTVILAFYLAYNFLGHKCMPVTFHTFGKMAVNSFLSSALLPDTTFSGLSKDDIDEENVDEPVDNYASS